jgi:hypothetical protein
MDKAELKIGFGDFEHLAASRFAFSATFEICRAIGFVARSECQIGTKTDFPDHGGNFPDSPDAIARLFGRFRGCAPWRSFADWYGWEHGSFALSTGSTVATTVTFHPNMIGDEGH